MKLTVLGMVCAAALSLASAASAANAQLEAPIRQFIDSFNRGDGDAAAATHLATGVTIIDEVPPYIWQGPKAFSAWAGDLATYDGAAGITEEKVTLGPVTREVVSPKTAYLIVAVTYTFKQKGVAMREPAQMTFALTNTAKGWKIAGWSWTGPDPVAAK